MLLNDFFNSLSGEQVTSRSAPEPDDYLIVLALAAVIFVLQWAIRFIIIVPMGSVLLSINPNPKTMAVRKIKFAQSSMEMVIYGIFFVVGCMIVTKQPWCWPADDWFSHREKHTEMRNDFRLFYLLYGARYLQGLVNVYLEPKRKDFVEMLIHHSVTAFLVYLSYVHLHHRVGGIIMVLFDPADVPLHAAKCSVYIADARKDSKFQTCADIWFAVFAAVFTFTRMVIFSYVVWKAWTLPALYGPWGTPESCCWACLVVLLSLQIYWEKLLLVTVRRVLMTGQAEDVRSDASDNETKKQS